jgi:hypothetical protein
MSWHTSNHPDIPNKDHHKKISLPAVWARNKPGSRVQQQAQDILEN